MKEGRSPNVLLVCIDCLRSDFAVGDYGQKKPLFSSIEQEGTLFDTMTAAASTTTPAIASQMTGCYPNEHGIFSLQDFRLNNKITTLAEMFDRNNYHTQAEVTGPLTADTNLDRGFNVYNFRNKDRTVYTDWWQEIQNTIRSVEEPWFIYLHLWEAHEPRYPPPDAADDRLTYETCVQGVCDKIETIVDYINLDDTIFAVTGDHGESIRDETIRSRVIRGADQIPLPHTTVDTRVGSLHLPIPTGVIKTRTIRRYIYDNYLRPRGIELEDLYNTMRKYRKRGFPNAIHHVGHGYHVYDFLTRVPFGIVGTNVPNKGRCRQQVAQNDIFKTILAAAGISAPDSDGQNLLSKTVEEQPAFSRACGATLRTDANWLYAVRYDGWKLVKGKDRQLTQLFDLGSDPYEIHNIADNNPEKMHELGALLDEFISQEASARRENISEDEQEKMKEHLKELGYL